MSVPLLTQRSVGRWDTTKGLSQQYQAPLKDFLLERVAFEMHRRRTTIITISEFKALIESELDRRGLGAGGDQLISELLERSGLLRHLDDHLEFRHLLLQEFFAGRGIPSEDFLASVVADDWWLRPVVFFFGERPGDAAGLRALLSELGSRPAAEQYLGGIGIGLALQACYLANLEDKKHILGWVISTLAGGRSEVAVSAGKDGRFPTMGFLRYYLFGRDAVACSVLTEHYVQLQEQLVADAASRDNADTRSFWIIVGLIECGMCDEAEAEVKRFRPADKHLLLAIHLGAFLTQHLRHATKAQKDAAQRICERIGPAIVALRDEVVREFHSELLELQKGSIAALPRPSTDQA